MIDIRKLKELVRLMVMNDLSEIDLRDSEEQVTIRRPSAHHHAAMPAGAGSVAYHPAGHAPAQLGAAHDIERAGDEADSADAEAIEEGVIAIESPMVGTFYSKPDPNAALFVNVGDHVNPQTVICLVEAMKIFNEIKAETSGRIERALVKNGEAVEFGQKLFLVKPD